MPNDLIPHFHGEAQHHSNNMGFKINNVFLLSNKKLKTVENKKLVKYRKLLIDFNNGKKNTPIETWIHWKIPYNKKEYPTLIVRLNSIIWWDFTNDHNLNLVSKINYYNNISDSKDVLIKNDNTKFQVKVTIMDKIGTFYFLCSVGSHAKQGHKIIIKVI